MSQYRQLVEKIQREKGIPVDDIRTIPDYPRYAVTRSGDVYYLSSSGKLMNSKVSRLKYPVVQMVNQYGQRRGINLGRVVASAFLGPCDNCRVIHEDNDLQNNHIDNLKWSTKSWSRRREPSALNGTSWLNADKVADIYQRLLRHETMREIASHYDVSPQTIQLIKSGALWSNVIGPDKRAYLNGYIHSGKIEDAIQWAKSISGESDIRQVPPDVLGKKSKDHVILVSDQAKIFVGKWVERDPELAPVDNDPHRSEYEHPFALSFKRLRTKRMFRIGDQQFMLARLVAYAFLGKPQNGEHFLRLIDQDPGNAALDNLEWVRCPRNPDYHAEQGKKLTVDDVLDIYRALKDDSLKIDVRALSAQYALTPASIYNIRNGRSWGWLTGAKAGTRGDGDSDGAPDDANDEQPPDPLAQDRRIASREGKPDPMKKRQSKRSPSPVYG